MYISRITISLDTHKDLTFADFHNLVNAHTPGLKLDRDIITNPLAGVGFYVTGVNPRACRAIAVMALDYNIPVVRLDLTFCSPVSDAVKERSRYLEYGFQKERLVAHLAATKYNGGSGEHTRFDTHYFQVGGDKAIKQLEIADHTVPPEEIEALTIVWRLRNSWAKEGWSIIQHSSDYQEGVDNSFCAATNFFLGPDFFHLGHNQELFFNRQAVEKPKPVKDWRLMLDEVCKVYEAEQTQFFDVYDLITDFRDYLEKSYGLV
jgi:hypothetical protein